MAAFNFIVPNLTNDMHDPAGSSAALAAGDAWLAAEAPKILAAPAYTNGGALFILWDEGLGNADGPLGLLALSPRIKRPGYTNSIPYTHSSRLRTVQDLFGLRPYLGEATYANNLADLFKTIALTSTQWRTNACTLTFTNLIPGHTNYIQVSTNLAGATWHTVKTNVATASALSWTDAPGSAAHRFYRVLELP